LALKDINIQISAPGLRNLIKKYKNTGSVGNKKRTLHRQRLISNEDLYELVLKAILQQIWMEKITRYCEEKRPKTLIIVFIRFFLDYETKKKYV